MTQTITDENISRYQMLVVRKGLQAVQKGFRLNTRYTPKNLRLMTEKITGRKFKARDYAGMIEALDHQLCEHHLWVEGVDEHGELIEPAFDVCIHCGLRRD